FTLALFCPVKLTTEYFCSPMVCTRIVALFVAAAFRKPYGVIQISSCCTHGVLAPTMIVWVCGCSPRIGCWPPPRGGVSPWIRTRSTRDEGTWKSITRLELGVNNRGPAELRVEAS